MTPLQQRAQVALEWIGANPIPARYYAESDGDPHTKTYYVTHSHRFLRIDCASMAEARALARSLNETNSAIKESLTTHTP